MLHYLYTHVILHKPMIQRSGFKFRVSPSTTTLGINEGYSCIRKLPKACKATQKYVEGHT